MLEMWLVQQRNGFLMWFHLNTLKFKWPRGRGRGCHVDSTAPGGCIWGAANSVSPPSAAGVGHGGFRVFQGVVSQISVRVRYGCIRPAHVCVCRRLGF